MRGNAKYWLYNKFFICIINALWHNIFKNYFKKMEIITENDIPSLIENIFEFTMNKAKNQIQYLI